MNRFIVIFLLSFLFTLAYAQQKEAGKLRQLLAKGKYESATKQAGELLKKFPKNPEISLMKARSAWYFSRNPKNKDSLYFQGMAFADFRQGFEWDKEKRFTNEDTNFLVALKQQLHYQETVFIKKKQTDKAKWHTDFLAKYFADTSVYYATLYPEWTARKNQEQLDRIYRIEAIKRAKEDSVKFSQVIGTDKEYAYFKNYDYSGIDTWVSKIPAGIKDFSGTVAYLTKGAKNEQEKVRAIFKWIARNVIYDYSFKNYSALVTFENKTGVCQGFADLFIKMCEEAGIEAQMVTGYAKGTGYKPGSSRQSNHAWNAVMLHGHYYLIESTWASCLGSGTDNFYFLANPEQLIFTHLPSDNKWQFLKKAVDFNTFDSLDNPYPGSFTYKPDAYKKPFITSIYRTEAVKR